MKKQTFFFILPFIIIVTVFFNSCNCEQETTNNAPQPTAATQDWFTTITGNIAASEYAFTKTDDGNYTAVNRRNGLRLQVSQDGFSAEKRETADWKINFRVKNILAGETSITHPSSSVSAIENEKLAYHFQTHSIEYINDPAGLRQNFIIHKNPSEASQLKVELTVAPEFEKQLRGNTLVVKDIESEKFYYSDLYAFDAAGKELTSTMQLDGDVLALCVDATNALYPVTIDPLSTTPDWGYEGNQAAANMAFAVSTAGDVNSDGYDDVVVGAAAYDAGQTDEGKAFLFLGGPSGLATTPVWQDEGDNAGGLMGKAVAAAGDVNGDGFDDLLIGLGLYSGGESEEGRAHVYYGNATGVSTEPDWIYEANQASAGLGFPLEGLGDVNNDGYDDIIVGANGYDAGQEDEGRAYGFYGSATGLPSSPSWTVEGNNIGAQMGHAVSAAGDVNNDGYDDAIVGGWGYSGAITSCGKAWVYLGSASGLSTTAVWELEGGQENGYYAFWVSGVGDVNKDNYDDIIVGAKRWDAEFEDEGKAWLYLGGPSGPSLTSSWTQEGDNDGAEYAIQFGPAGDVNGDGIDDLIMGSHFHSESFNKEGKALLYLGSYGGLATTPAWTFLGGVDQANLGWTCDGAGDVNNDGYADVIVGAFKYSNPETYEGKAFVFHGFNNCTVPPSYTLGTFTSTTAAVSWGVVPAASNYKITARRTGSTLIFYSSTTSYTMTGLTAGKKYKSWVQARCGAAWSLKSNTISFMTPPMRTGEAEETTEPYPNPASDVIYLNTDNFRDFTTVVIIYDAGGKVMKEVLYEAEDDADKIGIDISDMPDGLYMYALRTPYKTLGGMFVKK
ncbi:MAG: fibronectin type III domain-containing protein [Chitinophagales bacterium]